MEKAALCRQYSNVDILKYLFQFSQVCNGVGGLASFAVGQFVGEFALLYPYTWVAVSVGILNAADSTNDGFNRWRHI